MRRSSFFALLLAFSALSGQQDSPKETIAPIKADTTSPKKNEDKAPEIKFEELNHKGPKTEAEEIIARMNLPEAIAITLQNQLEIQISQMQIAEQSGVVEASAGPFDPVISGNVTHLIKEDRQYFPGGIRTNWGAHETQGGAAFQKLTRLGTSFSLQATLDQNYDLLGFLTGQFPAFRSNQGAISFIIDQPLLKGFIWGSQVTQEMANMKQLVAQIYDNLSVIADRVTQTVFSYWDVIASKDLVRVRQQNLDNFLTLQKNTKILIDNLILAKAEILQPDAQVAQAQVDLFLAKQQLYASLQTFLFNIGLSEMGEEVGIDDAIEANFPEIPTDFPILFEQVNRFIKYAIVWRPDILASKTREEAAAIIVKGGYNALLPQLDIIGGVTKQDFYKNNKAISLARPLNMRVPETDYSIGVSFSYPICNNAAEGSLYQSKAVLQRIKLTTRQIIRETYEKILNNWSDLIATSRALAESRKFVDDNTKLVQFEMIKLQAGYSTLFVLIDFQNRLTNGLIQEIELKRRFMQNIVQLRLLTGTLIIPSQDLQLYRVEDVLTLPVFSDDEDENKPQTNQR